MRANIDLTENRDFAKRINHRIFTVSEILFENITNEEEFEVYSKQHCDRCGKLISVYPWNKHYDLCEDCEYQYLRDDSIKVNPLKREENIIKSCVLKSNKIDINKPWFIRENKDNIITRLRERFRDLNI